VGDDRQWIADLIIKPGRVALHLLVGDERARPSNRLWELPVDEALGCKDPNWRLMCRLQCMAQAMIDRWAGALA
jgi:hypothetical protein